MARNVSFDISIACPMTLWYRGITSLKYTFEWLHQFNVLLIQVVAGQWLFGSLTCDVFNANDVLFSTASLLHLCCISWDRYIAVTDPFNYERRMTRRRAALTLAGVWTASASLSHIPIHLGLYTTPSQRDKLAADSNECSFKVCRRAPYDAASLWGCVTPRLSVSPW